MISRAQRAKYAAKIRHFIVHDLLHADDTPHRLALGCAVGIFVAFTPTIPFQMALTIAFAWMLGANKSIGVPLVWITNPATVIPIYLPLYIIGCWLLGQTPGGVDFQVLLQNHGGFWNYAQRAWEFTLEIFWPLWTGSLLVASLLAVATYFISHRIISLYRLKKYGQLTPPADSDEDAPSGREVG